MRSQMAKMQNRITELEEAKGIAAVTKTSPDSILPQSQIRSAQAVRSQRDVEETGFAESRAPCVSTWSRYSSPQQ
jgi:hypothetical protein